MPFDVQAEVLSNARLSPDYNVLSLAAPDIARSPLDDRRGFDRLVAAIVAEQERRGAGVPASRF